MAGKPNQKIPIAPLTPIPVVEEPFSMVIIDCVGPLPKTKKGNEFLLTIMDFTTHFPEAVPLRNTKTRTVIDALATFLHTAGLFYMLLMRQKRNVAITKALSTQHVMFWCIRNYYNKSFSFFAG